MTESAETTSEVLRITDTALEKVMEIRAAEDAPDEMGLRVEIVGAQGNEFVYDLSLERIDEADADDLVWTTDDLVRIVPGASADRLRGAVLDLPADPRQGGLVIRNPNTPGLISGDLPELEGTVSERVEQLLELAINPGLASHGGYAALERIEEPIAYVTMGGGCQGCALSAVTLRDGISSAIVEAVPEINEVVDVTEHADGENPFYAEASDAG